MRGALSPLERRTFLCTSTLSTTSSITGRIIVDPGSLFLLLVTFGLLFMIFTRGRRQQREAQLLQSRLAPGAEVMTTSGMYATLVELRDDGVAVLETASGQRSRWDRRAIARIVSGPAGGQEETAAAAVPYEPATQPPASTPPVQERPADSTAPSDRD